MATKLKLKRGNTSATGGYTGDSGEITVDTDKKTAVIHDGATAGGLPLPTLVGAETLTNKTLTSPVLNTGVSGTAILDADNMSTASDTTLATSESIKAYVDAQILTEDTLAELNDTDISSLASGNVLLYDGSNSWDNKVMSGDATIANTGAITVNADAITYAKIQNVSATNKILGRDSASAGIIEEISPANVLTMLGVETGATSDQTNAEIRTLVDSATDSNVYTDAEKTKVSNTSNTNTGDQTLPTDFVSAASGGTFSGAVTLPSPVINTGVSGSAILDSNTMSGHSTSTLSTSTSIKAYVDAHPGDITGVTAGDGLTGGGTSGDLTMTVVGGTGITANANDIAIDATVATLAGNQTFAGTKVFTSTATLYDPVFMTAVSGSAILNSNTMSGNSTITLATSASIKAYVDTTVSATNELFEDSTPQLGGSLDVLAQVITTSTTNGHIRFDKGITEKIGTSSNSGTTVTVDLATGNFFQVDLASNSGNIVTFTINNINGTSNQLSNFVLKIENSGSNRLFTWSSIVSNGTNIWWAGGTGPDITAGDGSIDILSFTSYNNGGRWYGAIVGQEFS